MHASTEKIVSHLCCPDDQKSLRSGDEGLECRQCGRTFPVWKGEIIELLPKKPAEPRSNPEYAADYQRQFHQKFENQEDSIAWGLREAQSPSWKLHRERQARRVLTILRSDGAPLKDMILCDVSAGVGDYTLSYARHFKWVLHCDLSVDALRYASGRFRRMGLENVFFLRVDYFALPFSRSIDRLLCLDTLIRGKDHEKALLKQIQRAISAQGRAIIDFHHWWHNPLRRLGLLRQNFGNNFSYARSGAEGLMRECGIEDWRLVRFHQELEPAGSFEKRLSWMLPATRLVYEFGAGVSGPSSLDNAEASFSTNSQLDP
jgi:ubiquinone/menaquinone biosynthesis C-methylase UbiE